MSITALITGKLLADPERRTGSSGKPFTTARLLASADDESVFCSCIAFGTTGEQLAALGKGDTLAITGRTKPKAWVKDGEPKAGLDVVADQVLTVYHARRKRSIMNPEPADPTSGDPAPVWSTRAGFTDRFQAENAGCGPGNAAKFKGGRRVAA